MESNVFTYIIGGIAFVIIRFSKTEEVGKISHALVIHILRCMNHVPLRYGI